MGEGRNVNAQIVRFDNFRPQPDIARKLLDKLAMLFRRQSVAFAEGERVIVS